MDIIERSEQIDKAKKALKVLKEIEKKTKMYTITLNNKTVISCKNKDKIEQYRKLNPNRI